MQALYQWDLSAATLSEIEVQFLEDEDFSKADKDYFHELLHEVPARLDEVEQAFTPYLDRPLSEIDPVERAVLRMASYELLARIEARLRRVAPVLGRLITVFGSKASVGTTTLTINLALALLKIAQKKVLLVDWQRPLGDVVLYLGLPQKESILESLLPRVHELDGRAFTTAL